MKIDTNVMNNPIIDFFIGLTMVNVLPHYLFGILRIRMLSLYGFGDKQNIAYAWTSLIVSIILFHINHGILNILDHPWYPGGMFVILAYLILGKYLIKMWRVHEIVDQ